MKYTKLIISTAMAAAISVSAVGEGFADLGAFALLWWIAERRRPQASSLVAATYLVTTLALENVLIVVEAFEEKLFLAARNLPSVEVLTVAQLDPVSLARHDKVLATVAALKMLEERLA